MSAVFPVLILNARPAAGKSEIISYLEGTPLQERIARFHVGTIHVIDDFPMLWAWFEEDEILERIFNRPRMHSDKRRYFLHDDFWNVLIRRLNLEYEKWTRDSTSGATALIEFSRGSQHGGYREAYAHLSETILSRAACLYVRVSHEEAIRKNRQRYNPDRPDSILEHGLPDEKMERLYRLDDWDDFSAEDRHLLHVRNHLLPYAVFENEDDLTTTGGDALGDRLNTVMNELWRVWQTLHRD